jgi:hypothetical protein
VIRILPKINGYLALVAPKSADDLSNDQIINFQDAILALFYLG